MRVDPKSLSDGILLITGGMDSGLSPSFIGNNKVAFARNVVFRGGRPQTRPGWRRRTLDFDDSGEQSAFENGLFQGAASFEPMQGGYKLVASVAGRLFRIDVDDRFQAFELTGADTNSAIKEKAWFEQAEDFLIVQDNESSPLIYDGANLRRVDQTATPKEVYVGNAMVYANGRLWVALPSRKEFVAGNLVGGEDGTAAYNGRDSVLKFSENAFLNGGGTFSVPFNAGRITAMRAIAILDTSLGQGPIQIFTERGVFSVNAPFDRTQWQNLEYPIQTVSLLIGGARSQEGTILVNGDIWFRASDGIRSFQVARRDFGSWVNTPLSTEMNEVIKNDDPSLLDHASAILFDNRYLVTASPFRVKDHGICWRGLIALDFHNVSGITTRTNPIYDGIWTGLNILQVVPLGDRCFIFALNSDEKIELWEVSRDDHFDNGTTRIAAFMDSPRFGFGDTGWARKELSTGDLWHSDLIGQVNFAVKFRPDNHPCFIDWHSWSVDAKDESCLTADCQTPASLQPQYRTRQRLPLPSEDCNARDNSPYRKGYEHQVRVAWTGHARIDKLRLVAHEIQEDTLPFCQPSEATDTAGINCCDSDLFSYRSDA